MKNENVVFGIWVGILTVLVITMLIVFNICLGDHTRQIEIAEERMDYHVADVGFKHRVIKRLDQLECEHEEWTYTVDEDSTYRTIIVNNESGTAKAVYWYIEVYVKKCQTCGKILKKYESQEDWARDILNDEKKAPSAWIVTSKGAVCIDSTLEGTHEYLH